MADETKFKLDLDNQEFVQKLLQSKNLVLELGDSKNLVGLIEGLTTAGIVAGTLAVAYFGVKAAFELAFDAEKIKAVNAQFEILAQNAGVSGQALHEGLSKAADGLIDDTELLKLANKGLVELGDNAKRLPEIMELARKVTAVMGGDVASNFENLSQAIANGNQRALKHMGLMIDVNEATKTYAKSLGVTVDSLSQAGKQTAILNEVISVGGTRYKGAKSDALEMQNTWTQFKVTVKEFGEAFAIMFEGTVGPYLKKFLHGLKNVATFIKTEFVSNFGEGTEKTKAQIKSMQEEVEKLQYFIEQSKKNTLIDPATVKYQVDEATKHLEELKKKIADLKGPEAKTAEAPVDEEAVKQNKVKNDRIREEDLKFQKELLTMREKHEKDLADAHIRINGDSKDVDRIIEEDHQTHMDLLQQDHSIKRQQISQQESDGKITLRQRDMLLAQEQMDFDTQITNEEAEWIEKKKDIMAQHYTYIADHAQKAQDRIKAGWQGTGAETVRSLEKSSNMGKVAFTSLSKNSAQAFKAMGDGSKTAGEALKGALFSSLADIAEAKGEYHIAEGLASMNPMEFAEGGVLMALGGFLRSQGGGGGGGGAGASGGGGGGGSVGSASTEAPNASQSVQQKKTLTVNFQGPVFDTDATRTRLTELIRESSDMTDFRVLQVGQS